MAKSAETIEVYIETGKKKTFAGAVEWPGWCRSGKDEESALRALADYGQRYAQVAKKAQIEFRVPAGPPDFTVVERLVGDATTDFGAPAIAPSADARAVDAAELARLQALLKACYQALDDAARAAQGRELRKGPRGGGRELEDIQRHVMDANGGYLSRLGLKAETVDGEGQAEQAARLRQAMLDGLAATTRGETPEIGPRGGKRWSPRYFVRREAWHVLDHAWEIEDRAG
jgi:hypothetical protein